jgi:hypothetical protein
MQNKIKETKLAIRLEDFRFNKSSVVLNDKGDVFRTKHANLNLS